MSWARVDDGLWEHEKFERLRAERAHTAMSLWLLALSYCGRKANARLTVAEAGMLLLCDEAGALEACEVLRSSGLLDTDPASQAKPSFLVHDWKDYRPKNEAKARAGAKGGIKSGESRRRKTKAETDVDASTGEATSEQTRTPDPDPDPDPVTRYPIPDPDPDPRAFGTKPQALNGSASAASAWKEGQPIGNIDDLTIAVSSVWRWSISIGAKERARAHRLYPLEVHEIQEHKPKADAKPEPKWRLAFLLGCIEHGRNAANDELAKGKGPSATQAPARGRGWTEFPPDDLPKEGVRPPPGLNPFKKETPDGE